MATITNLKMWKDTGYTDGTSELPPLDHVFGTPDITYDENIHPSKDRLFSQFQLPIGYSDLLPISYMNFTLSMDNGEDIDVYAWVDDVQLRSDTDGSPLTFVDWHVDPWMTFGRSATFGSGFVIRRPSTDHDYFQNYQYRYKTLSGNLIPIFDKSSGDGNVDVDWWAILCVQTENQSGTVTSIRWYVMPMEKRFTATSGFYISSGTDTGRIPTIYSIMTATFDETLKLNPKAITGAWLSPMCPIPGGVSGKGTSSEPFGISAGNSWEVYMTPDHVGCFRTKQLLNNNIAVFNSDTVTFSKLTSLEGNEVVIVDPTKQNVGVLPFGRSATSCNVRLMLTATTASIRFEMGTPIEGLVFSYPLPALDVNSNSWSDYMYSGQRDYDIQQRNLNTNSRMIEGTSTGGFIGGLIGATGTSGKKSKEATKIGAATGNVGVSPFAVGVGMLVGAGGSLISGALDHLLYNKEFQNSEDRFHANQTDTILMGGDCTHYLYFNTNGQMYIGVLNYDATSAAYISDFKEVQGVLFNSPVVDCSDLISTGGPLQINNLIVRGEIPAMAKKWITNKFANGVRIVER